MHDFLIVGGGINGLLLARELAKAQSKVLLIDRGCCGKEASWAGGGIISPLYPWRYGPAVTALASWAQDFYPALVTELWQETGIDSQLQRSGLLMLEAEDEREALAWARREGRPMAQLDSTAISAKESHVRSGYQSALWMPDVANVRNPRLVKALVASLNLQSNVHIMEQCQLVELVVEKQQVVGARVRKNDSEETITAGTTIFSAGAWSGDLLAMLDIELPVFPVKGQMLLYQLPAPIISSIVLTGGRYLIPRRDKFVLAGSTLEYCGFDKTPTDEAYDDLHNMAISLVPELAKTAPVAHWAGLRPGAPQGVPFIGRLPEYTNLYVNAGQFRNGLVLAPASARLLADELLGRQPILDSAPYQPAGRIGQSGN